MDQNKEVPRASMTGEPESGRRPTSPMTTPEPVPPRTHLEARLDLLERRVRSLDDRNEIVQLLASYGPSVDSGLSTIASGLWSERGVYDVDTGRMNGRSEIETMIGSHPHQGFLETGCGHVMSPPHITISRNTAVAICHSQLILRRPGSDGYQVLRVTANRWELARTVDGWKVVTRTSRLLDGRDDARAILASAFSASSGDFAGPMVGVRSQCSPSPEKVER